MRWIFVCLILLCGPLVAKPKLVRTMDHRGRNAQYLVYSPDGHWLAAWILGQIQIWDPATGKKRAVLDAKKRGLIGFSNDSRRVFTTAGHKVECWSCPALKPVSAKPDGSFVIKSSIFHLLSGFGVRSEQTVNYPYHEFYSRIGKIWATSGLQCAEVRTVAQDKLLWTSPDTGHDVTAVTVSPDGKRLAYGTMGASLFLVGDLTARVKKPRQFVADGEIRAIASNQEWVAIGCADMSDKIYLISWDGGRVESLEPAGGDTWALAFSPDGTQLASGHELEKIHLWKLR